MKRIIIIIDSRLKHIEIFLNIKPFKPCRYKQCIKVFRASWKAAAWWDK
jgi:hypothetical protein